MSESKVIRKIPFFEGLKIMQSYLGIKLSQQIGAVTLLCLVLITFQIVVLDLPIPKLPEILLGLVLTILGLTVFLEGLSIGLMPLAENTGVLLPRKLPPVLILFFVAILGFLATLAEPGISVLKSIGSNLRGQENELVAKLLTNHGFELVIVIGASIGIAAIIGIGRFINDWKIKPILMVIVFLALLMSVLTIFIPGGNALLGIAWDCGGITTGPVTVPLMIALGVGTSRSFGSKSNGINGFGIIAVAALIPVLGVLGLGLIISQMPDVATNITQLDVINNTDAISMLINAFQAVLPLAILLLFIHRFILNSKIKRFSEIGFGILLTILGLALLNLGIFLGLNPLGQEVGKRMAATVKTISLEHESYVLKNFELKNLVESYINEGKTIETFAFTKDGQTKSIVFEIDKYNSISHEYTIIDETGPHFPRNPLIGYVLIVLLGGLIGYLATRAEPTLLALGKTIEEITVGVRKQKAIVTMVSIGVGLGISLGFVFAIAQIPYVYLILILYGLALICTFFTDEETIALSYDGAGVTVGPITIPIILSLGLGLSSSLGLSGGFGILAAGGALPILLLLIAGLWSRRRAI